MSYLAHSGDTTLHANCPNCFRKLTLALWVSVLFTLLGGCHRRGYTDLYVDAMAKEIRDLQDQLYEYDHEYRLLEQELESLRRQNSSLKSTVPPGGSSGIQSLQSPLEFLPRDSQTRELLPAPKKPLGNGPSNSGMPKQSPPSIISEPEGLRSAPRTPPEEIQSVPLDSPSTPSDRSKAAEDFDFDVDEILIPSITNGAAKPPSLSPRNLTRAPENDLEVGLSQIELPYQLASSSKPGRGAKISEAAEVVTDRRVVEVAFHPILSRSVNFDDDDYDDGLFLVLQPRNQQGQFVPTAAALVVEVVDAGRDGDQSKIGLWRYSASEVAGKMQPIGSQQGIHLTLPWNGPNPKADRVMVKVTYSFENGRQVVANKMFYVSGTGALKTVWAPRAGSGASGSANSHPGFQVSDRLPSDRSAGGVVPASGTSLGGSGHPVPAASGPAASGPFLPPAAAPAPQR